MHDKVAKKISGSYLISFHFDNPIHKDEKEIIVSSFFNEEVFLELDLKKMEGRLVNDYNAFGLGEYGGEEKELVRTVKISEVEKHTITLEEPVQL